MRAFKEIPLAIRKLREFLPANKEELGALVLEKIGVRLHVPEEKIRAVVERDDVLGRVVSAIKRSGNLLLEEILDAALLHRRESSTKQKAVRARHNQALRDRFPKQRSGLAAAASALEQGIARFGRVEFTLDRLRRVEAADVDISWGAPGHAASESRSDRILFLSGVVLSLPARLAEVMGDRTCTAAPA
jgi:hypothetical protein